MANYALVVGADIRRDNLAHAFEFSTYENTRRMHNFLHSLGFISMHRFEIRSTLIGFRKEIKALGNTLQKGDRFLCYYYGRAAHSEDEQFILPYTYFNSPNPGFDISYIDEHTAVDGVERTIILDTYSVAQTDISGRSAGINENVIERTIEKRSPQSPIGFYYKQSEYFPPEGQSLLAKAVEEHFSHYAHLGSEISFPGVGELISETIQEQESNMFPDVRRQPPCFKGDKVVLLPATEAHSERPSSIPAGQERKKFEVDQLLDKLICEHEKWLSDGRTRDNHGQLTWPKMEPVLRVYDDLGMGPPRLTDRMMDYVDFDLARFPYKTSFSGSSLRYASFKEAQLDTADFSRCSLQHCRFQDLRAIQCDFSHSNLVRASFEFSVFIDCSFNDSSLAYSTWGKSILDKSSFVNANITYSLLPVCSARETNFTDADLSISILIQTDISGSILTGVKLYGTARSDWCIEEVECQYVYWDRRGNDRFPPDNDFEEGEFITQYRPYTMFSYTFKDGFTPLDLILATHIVDQINAADMGFSIKIDNASIRGLNPTLNFVMETGDDKREEASKLFKAEYEHRISLLEQKLQSSETLLAERGRRADLTEQQLSEMTAVVKQTFSGEKFGLNARQLLVEHLFTPVMEEVFREDGLIARYAASKSKGIDTLEAADLAQYRYVALFGAGRHESAISKSEFDLIRTGLANFMKDDCLMIQDAELKNAPEDSYIKSIYRMFNAPPADDAFVAIATVHAGINDKILKRPVYHELKREEHESWDLALNRALEKLRASLFVKSIKDFSLPALPSKKQTLACPNGNLIRKLREDIGSLERACEIKAYRNEHEPCFLSKNTLIKAEKGEPITKTKLEDIARVLKTAASRLVFEHIVPNRERLKELREAVFCTEEELLEQFGVSTPVFFDLLLEEKAVPADTLRYVHHHYKQLIGSKADPFVKLVDVPATEDLAG